MKKEKAIPTSDIYFAAFASLNKIQPKFEKHGDRVTFVFTGDENFFKIYQKYFGNQPIPVTDFVAELKKIKSQMYGLKGEV